MNFFRTCLVLSGVAFTAHSKRVKKTSIKHLKDHHASIKLKPGVASQIQQFRHTAWSQHLNNVISRSTNNNALCEDPIEKYIISLVSNIDPEILQLVQGLGIDQIPLYYSLLVNHDEHDEYFGTFGEETIELILANHALENFWDTADDDGGQHLITNNIMLLGMHGTDMKDTAKLVPTLEQMYDLTDSDYSYSSLADEIQTLIVDAIPHEFDNPIFTFNAYASSDEIGGERIVMGDGIIEYLQYKNLGSDGPEVVLAHEWGHEMQYEAGIDILGTLPEPQESRRYELMADSFSGYFLAHRDGGNMQDYRVLELSMAAFAVGDCNVDSDGHHGTPLQRKCALIWGVNQAASATGTGVLHPDELQALFDKDLAAIVGLDGDVCKLSFVTGGLPGDNRAFPGASNETSTTTVTVTTTTKTETKTVKSL